VIIRAREIIFPHVGRVGGVLPEGQFLNEREGEVIIYVLKPDGILSWKEVLCELKVITSIKWKPKKEVNG